MAEIGRKLGVSYLLEGSVRRAGDRVRITAQLIEAATGAHVWAERYDRSLEDVFAVQEEVARSIAWTLVGRIEDARLQQTLRQPTSSLAAYDCVLRGLAHFRGYAPDDNQKAYDFFQQAVALDPHYAVAHAYHAVVWVGMHGHASAPAEVLDTAFEIAAHAAALDPNESRCERALAFIWLYRRQYATAEHHFRRAHELNPNDADRMMGMGYVLAARGKAEEGLRWMEEAMRLNPFYPTWYRLQLGIALYSLRHYGEAAEALKSRPNASYWSRARVAACYAQLGQTQLASMEAAEVLRILPAFSAENFLQTDVLLERIVDREHLREGLLKAGLPP